MNGFSYNIGMNMKECSYKISGLDCPNCASKLADHIKKDGGFDEVFIDFYNETLLVKGKEATKESIQSIIDKYEDGVSLDKEEDDEKGEIKELVIKSIRVTISLTLVLLGLFLFNEKNYGIWVNLAINLVAYIIVAYDVYINAAKNLFREKNPFDENFLMIIASLGAFALRFFGPEHNEFFDASLLMILFQVGDAIEDIATERSKKAIRKAGMKRAIIAHKKMDSSIIDIKPEKLKIGDEIIVKTGEIIPIDGEVIEGDGSIDLSSLTGEFNPENASVSSCVYSGTVLSEGSLVIKANKAYEDSTSSRMQKLIEQSSSNKSKTDKFINKFAKIYTPIIVVLAFVLATIPPLIIGYDDMNVWHRFIYVGLCFLVISCPCAIVISIPLAFFSGIGVASKNGIIVKGSSFFDEINSIKYFASDKTGTLTNGEFDIKEISPVDIDENTFLEYLKAGESRSNHPIAKAMLKNEDISGFSGNIDGYSEVKGKGISLIYKGFSLLLGNASFLKENGVVFEEAKTNSTSVHLSVNGKYKGYISLEDKAKEDAKNFVDSLKSSGVKTILLSGDKEEAVKGIASELGIDECYPSLLPEEKCSILEQYIAKGKTCFMGDGINDAASIRLADIGIAMGDKGSDLAIENADVIITNDKLSSINKLCKIAKKTRNRAIFNIVVALTVKFVFMALALSIPGFPLYLAVVADTGLLVALIISSLLLLKMKIR